MPLPAYVQKVFDEEVAKTSKEPTFPSLSYNGTSEANFAIPEGTGIPDDIEGADLNLNYGTPEATGLPDYVKKAMEEKGKSQQSKGQGFEIPSGPFTSAFKIGRRLGLDSVPESDPDFGPQEWDPEWMREHPFLAGLYGAGKGLLEQAVVPTIDALGMAAGSLYSPVAGTALGYGIARQLNDYLVDGYKRLGGEDPRRPTFVEEMIQSASDVGTVLLLGKAVETGARIAPAVEGYLFHTLPKRLYGRAINTPMSKKWIQTLPDEIVSKQTAAIEEGLSSRVSPGEYGLSKIKGLQREVDGYIDDITSILSKDPKNFVSREAALEKGLEKAYAKASNASDPVEAKAIVDSIAERFRAHPTNMTPAKANQVKRQLYDEVRFGSGEGATAIKTQMESVGKKGVAREIMLNLEDIYPALAELNATSAARISLHEAIEKSFARELNKNAIPLGAKVLMRPKTWPLAIWEATMGHPQVKTRLAFALHKANPTKYPAKPSEYVPPAPPVPPKPDVPLRYEPPIKTPAKSALPKPLPKVESPDSVVGKPISGNYTPDQLNKMLGSKNATQQEMAIEDIITTRKKVAVSERERRATINDMLKTLKNERGSIGSDIVGGKKKLTKPAQSTLEVAKQPHEMSFNEVKVQTQQMKKDLPVESQKPGGQGGMYPMVETAFKMKDGSVHKGISHNIVGENMPTKYAIDDVVEDGFTIGGKYVGRPKDMTLKGLHRESVKQAIKEGKIKSHPDYPELTKPIEYWRGAKTGEFAEGDFDGVWVSQNKIEAEQWGPLHKYKPKEKLNLLDSDSKTFENVANKFVKKHPELEEMVNQTGDFTELQMFPPEEFSIFLRKLGYDGFKSEGQAAFIVNPNKLQLVKPSTTAFNKLYPEHDLKFDGAWENGTLQVTPQKGPYKGRSFNVESLEPKAIKAKLDNMKPNKGGSK